MIKHQFVASEEDMLMLGGKIAKICPKKALIFLSGDLGAGKTCLVRGFLQAYGYKGKVKSPTYTLVEPYHFADKTIYHFDLYRLTSPLELYNIGLEDYFADAAICVIEWPERGQGVLPPADLTCYIELENPGRLVTITTNNPLFIDELLKG